MRHRHTVTSITYISWKHCFSGESSREIIRHRRRIICA